jgi:hypothetical protein
VRLLLSFATAERIGADHLSASRLNQFAQRVQVLSAGVADHEVAKAIVVPGPDFNRQCGPHSFILACVSQSPILENEDRNLVLAEAKNEFRTAETQLPGRPAYPCGQLAPAVAECALPLHRAIDSRSQRLCPAHPLEEIESRSTGFAYCCRRAPNNP